jgi:hypothetical protein
MSGGLADQVSADRRRHMVAPAARHVMIKPSDIPNLSGAVQ